MEQVEKPIISLNEFELTDIKIAAKGGRVSFKWLEHWSENKGGGDVDWTEEKQSQIPRLRNDIAFLLFDKLAEILAKRAGVNFEAISVDAVKFHNRTDSVKMYDLGFKFKIAGEKETRSVSRITMQDLAHQSTFDYSDIEGLIIEMEANAYASCVLGQSFGYESDAIEIENGSMNF